MQLAPMKWLTWLLAVVVGASCVHVEATTRTERGPLLRTFHRPQIVEGGVEAQARVVWPTLELTITGHDTCRDLELEEYAEERTTERAAPAAGPALSTGITTLLLGAVLFGVSYAVSPAPDVSVIDRAGHYGASTQQLVRAWSFVSLGIGVPALAVGLIGQLQSTATTEHLRVEQVISQRDTTCNPRPLTGPVTLQGPQGTALTQVAVDGVLAVRAEALAVEVSALRFAGREVVLDEHSQQQLDGFGACVAVEQAGALDGLGEVALLERAALVRRCAVVRGDDVAGLGRAVEAATRRREAVVREPSASVPTYEAAVATLSPRLRLVVDSSDLALLDADPAPEGPAALVQGVVVEGMRSSLAVLQVGERSLYVVLPAERTWGYDFGDGTRVEGGGGVGGASHG
jgi:hypothetical protein